MVRWLISALILTFGAGVAAAGDMPLIHADFDDSPVGRPPRGLAYAADASKGEVAVVDHDSRPADPFDGEVNRSVHVRDLGEDQEMPRLGWRAAEPITSTGEVSIRFYEPATDPKAGTGPAFFQLAVGAQRRDGAGKPVSLVNPGPNLTMFSDGRIRYKAGGHLSQVAQTFPARRVHMLVMSFDVKQRTWSATLDGIQLTGYRGRRVRFPFERDIKQVDAVQLTVGRWKSTGMHAFFDDLVMTTGAHLPAAAQSDSSGRS